MINKQLALIQDIQSEQWWECLTAPMLEVVRRRIRDLVKLIEKKKRKPVYTDFQDEMGEQAGIELPGVTSSDESFATFRRKARAFLRQREDHVSINKLRNNVALTPNDLVELKKLLIENAIGPEEYIEQAKAESEGLGLFVRSLVGLDRQAAKAVMNKFLNGKTWSPNQIEFVNLIVNHLTENGVMEPKMLYEAPFTDVTLAGPEGIFTSLQIDQIMALLEKIKAAALAA